MFGPPEGRPILQQPAPAAGHARSVPYHRLAMSDSGFSNYIVYVDESGDHGLDSIDPTYPVFVLAFCIFSKEEYTEVAVPALQRLKFDHFGHDQVVLHEREVRKTLPPFQFLQISERRSRFMADLTALVEAAPFRLIASVIDKNRLKEQYRHPSNPYEVALAFGMERVAMHLRRRGECQATTHFVFESRGKKEDDQLRRAFQRVCDGENYAEETFPFEAVFADKRANSCGLQIADLLARPIGRHVIEPSQGNRAYEVIRTKFDFLEGQLRGYGLKVFPS